MTAERNFAGVVAPVLTPFGEDGAPDSDRFVEHAEWLLDNGCNALAPFGTTSEANSLGLDERMELLEDLVDSGIDPARLMPGTGACSIADAAILAQHAVDLGCGGCLVLPPFYYKNPSDEGLFRFFADVIEEVGDDRLQVYLYHIPPIAQVGFSLPLIRRLKEEFPDTVVGLKDSSGDWNNMKAILDAFPDFEMFPGSELFMLDGLRAGAAGVISATANINSALMRELFDGWQGEEAEALQSRIGTIRKAVQAYPVIPFLKGFIAHYRDDAAWSIVRPPLVEMAADEMEAAVDALDRQHNFKLTIEISV